jgi:DNA-directed RNA polymerase specialized sigma24 family protein
MEPAELKKNWAISESAFNGLLKWLDEGKSSDGRRYLEMSRRLADYFDRKNCLNSLELADETLNRVARRLEEETIVIETPAKYCYIVAKYVFLEDLRAKDRYPLSIDDGVALRSSSLVRTDAGIDDQRMDCLDACSAKLIFSDRDLIVGYYFGKERQKINNRRDIAKKLGISVNALSIRACRIREKLQICVSKCVASRE